VAEIPGCEFVIDVRGAKLLEQCRHHRQKESRTSDRRHDTGENDATGTYRPHQLPKNVRGVVEDVGQDATIGNARIERRLTEPGDIARVEKASRLHRYFETRRADFPLVEVELDRRQIGDGDPGPELAERDREPAGSGSDFQDAMARPNPFGQHPSMDLEGDPRLRRIVEPVPLALTEFIEVCAHSLGQRIHAQVSRMLSSSGTEFAIRTVACSAPELPLGARGSGTMRSCRLHDTVENRGESRNALPL
jgi:hypothetical protein